jgi:tRNA A37 threonylcarbamoyladenosine biosynthesis protein TsaE
MTDDERELDFYKENYEYYKNECRRLRENPPVIVIEWTEKEENGCLK